MPGLTKTDTNTACMNLDERLEKLQPDRREMVFTTEEFVVSEKQIALVERGQMIVRENGMGFTAIPKHIDFYVTTAEIPKEVLHQVMISSKN